MISRTILAALLAAGTAGSALAEVQVKTPGVEVEAPAGSVDINVNTGAKAMQPSEAWLNKPVYSSDGKHVGEISAVSGDMVYADIGGFLGLGETRVLLNPQADIAQVADDRIDLTLTAEQAEKLPAAPKDAGAAE